MDNIWNCHCGLSKPERYNTKHHEIIYCAVCFKHQINKIECSHEEKDFVKVEIANGTFQLRTICVFCKLVDGKSYKFDTVPDIDKVPILPNDHKNPNFWEDKKRISERITAKEKKWISEQKSQKYSEYLNSQKWKKIRQLALERDNYICQSCLSRKAEEVHHLTYTFIENEPLFTLVSVCGFCHEQIHQMMNGDKSQDLHK